jgi:hypothetical protein
MGPSRANVQQFRTGGESVRRIQEGSANRLGRWGPPGLPYADRIPSKALHSVDQAGRQGGLAGSVRSFDDDEKPSAHERVMMLLVAPFSIPSLIC